MALTPWLPPVALLALCWGPSVAGAQGEPDCSLPFPPLPYPLLTAGPPGPGHPIPKISPRKLPDPGSSGLASLPSLSSFLLSPCSFLAPHPPSHTPAHSPQASSRVLVLCVPSCPHFSVCHSKPLTSRPALPAFSLPLLLPQTLLL